MRALRGHGRLQRPSADFLLRLAEVLGQHSLTAAELKLLLQLLQQQQLEEGEEEQGFPYKSQIIHIISSIARGDGFSHSRQYFDIQAGRMLFNPLVRALVHRRRNLNKHLIYAFIVHTGCPHVKLYVKTKNGKDIAIGFFFIPRHALIRKSIIALCDNIVTCDISTMQSVPHQ